MFIPQTSKFISDFLVLFIVLIFYVSCNSENPVSPPIDSTPKSNQVENQAENKTENNEEVIDLEDPKYEISDFVWRGMNEYYYWQNDVPLLSDSQLSNLSEYKQLIKNNANPEPFFNKMLYKRGMLDGDRFSWFVHDYEEQEKRFSGINNSHGMDFLFARYSENSKELFGYVRVVHLNSNAEDQDVKRGMLFTRVNGEQITTDNYRTLIESNSYEITFSTPIFDEKNNLIGFKPSETIVKLTKQENFEENPLIVHKVIETSRHKIGYLYFHSFLGSNKRLLELNNVFGNFKSEGINELVVDLRYNRGGYSFWSDVMATAISGEGSGSVISKTFFNKKILDTYYNGEPLKEYFPQFIGGDIPINKLDLERVFFLTTKRDTASASEAVINNLEPYMDVQIIGDYTVGKNEGSITVLDYLDDNKVNPRHKIGLQPLILKSGNSKGFLNFEKGLEPDVILKEIPFNLIELGNPKEPLLNKAIQIITGVENRIDINSSNTKRFLFDFQNGQQDLLIFTKDIMNFRKSSMIPD